ncbi:MAG: tetratricopeptide repeat protein [Kiritimatiellia bacterium]
MGFVSGEEFPKADSAYRKILTLYPEDADALSGAAWSNFYQGQKTTAKTLFRRLLATNPDYPDAVKGLDLCM